MSSEIKTKEADLALLPAYKFYAVQQRALRIPYLTISRKINEKWDVNISEQTVKNWFWSQGSLYKFYRAYVDEIREMEKEATEDFIAGNLSKAAETLAMVMAGQGDSPQVAAAKIFLDRGLGKVAEKADINIKATIGIAMVDVLKAIDQIEDERKQDKDNTKSEE